MNFKKPLFFSEWSFIYILSFYTSDYNKVPSSKFIILVCPMEVIGSQRAVEFLDTK